MNDKLIINSISKIYFSIVSFFVFIFFFLSITYLLLNSGIHLKSIKTSSVTIDKLYIKWDEKLNIHIQKINILQNNTNKPFNLEHKNIYNNVLLSNILGSLVKSFIIEEIYYGDINATLHYTNTKLGYFKIRSNDFIVDIDIKPENDLVKLNIKNFNLKNKEIELTSNIIIDTKKYELYLLAKTEIGSDISLNIHLSSTLNELKYAVSSNKDIQSIKYLISLMNPNKALNYWINEAIEMEYFTLKNAYGFIDFKNSKTILENLYVHLNGEKLKYKYHPKLDDIHTKNTDLVFKDGVLFIIPNDSSTYEFELDSSWLKIDFNPIQEKLALYLQFDGIVDKHLLYLLSVYDIDLPFIQNSGYMYTDLKLDINLMSLDVDAKGYFYTNKANFTYLGLDLDLKDTLVQLNNFDIKISKMSAKYQDIAKANVVAELDLKNDTGFIDFNIAKIDVNKNLTLNTNNQKLLIKYLISPNQDIIHISKSNWDYSGNQLSINKLSVPFNLDTLFATIPTTKIHLEDMITAYISGSTSLKDFSTKLDIDIVKLNTQAIKLSQPIAPFNLNYVNNKLSIFSKEDIKFNIGTLKCNINKAKVVLNKDSLIVSASQINIEDFFAYDIDTNSSFKSIELNIDSTDEQTVVDIPNLNISTMFSKEKWEISFTSLSKVKQYSPFLQTYLVEDGNFSLYQSKIDENIHFLANIAYPYKILNINNKLLSQYILKGEIKENTIEININEKVSVSMSESIYIEGENIGINIDNVFTLLKDFNSTSSDEKSKNISMHLKNSFVHLNDKRRALIDEINLHYDNGTTIAQLIHKEGEAEVKINDNLFHIYGGGFGDEFMENLFVLAKFKKGTFDFDIKGDFEKYSGVLYIQNTTLTEYKMLNNILAFINTIPSLMTFSLPGYNKNGIEVSNAYIHLDYKDEEYKISDIYLGSKEISITGRGNASLVKNEIDLELSLKTDLGSTASKIPLVGYILFGEDTVSTTLEITGKLDDPTINSMIAKDIIVAPLNIIKRTLSLPFYLFGSKDEKK